MHIIEVAGFLTKWLRPHQRDGVRFMAECVLDQRDFKGLGCILADDMGLGKTLQSITLLYTLMTRGFINNESVCKKSIIICPTSLVTNWQNEIKKWLNNKLQVVTIIKTTIDEITDGINKFYSNFNSANVLIISYESIRRCIDLFLDNNKPSIDLMIFDEAHRLKNDQTRTYLELNKIKCLRRILLSGTPLQNDLNEFYAMINFTNPNVIGRKQTFNRYYQVPILEGREPYALDSDVKLGMKRSMELSAIINQFVLRRTNILLSKHLPPKVMQVICCKLTSFQQKIYQRLLKSKHILDLLRKSDQQDGKQKGAVLPLMNQLKSLCNHPMILYNLMKKKNKLAKDILNLYPNNYQAKANDGGKMSILIEMLINLKKNTNDRIVFISNYTSTLDIFEYICKQHNWGYVRLDGSVSVMKRQERVDLFNGKNVMNKKNLPFAFLLSSKAGGCGINLVGANRLILFDPDWNPAVDKQAAARIWRDGQTKRCFIYRMLTTGTLEERIYQRQLSKEGLAEVLGGHNAKALVSSDELKRLFSLDDTKSMIHDCLHCSCSNKPNNNDLSSSSIYNQGQRGDPKEEDLLNWAHHTSLQSVPDPLFRLSKDNNNLVSFIFSKEVQGKAINQQDTDQAKLVSAKCNESPIIKNKKNPEHQIIIKAAEAQQLLYNYELQLKLKRKRLRAKKRGIDYNTDDDEQIDIYANSSDDEMNNKVPIRISTRNRQKTRRFTDQYQISEDDDHDDDDDEHIVDENMDEATKKLIKQLMKQDQSTTKKKKKKKKKK